jgi:hypothetical protein
MTSDLVDQSRVKGQKEVTQQNKMEYRKLAKHIRWLEKGLFLFLLETAMYFGKLLQ